MRTADHLKKITDGSLDRSLTPAGDAAKIAIADMVVKLGPRLILSGPDGARARLAIAIQGAVHTAMARELDAGAPESGLGKVACNALGDVVASLAMKWVHDKPLDVRLSLVELYIAEIGNQAREVARRLDDLQPHEVSGVMAPRGPAPGNG